MRLLDLKPTDIEQRLGYATPGACVMHAVYRPYRAPPIEGRLFVVEMLVPDNGAAGSLCDLHLLAVTGGKERTAEEYAALLGEAGFEAVRVQRIPSLPSIIVGVAR